MTSKKKRAFNREQPSGQWRASMEEGTSAETNMEITHPKTHEKSLGTNLMDDMMPAVLESDVP